MVSEVDLARAVRTFLEQEGWTTFAEVEHEGCRADIVATRGPETWIVEVKAARSIAVIEQALGWRGETNCVWVAVPKPFRDWHPAWDFSCARDGLGVFSVAHDGEVEIYRSPTRHRMTDLGIRASLNDAQRDFAEAGNADNARYTPFALLRDELIHQVGKYPGLTLREFVETTEHHYASDEFAAASLRRVLKSGGIKGLVVRHGGRVYAESHDRHSVSRSKP